MISMAVSVKGCAAGARFRIEIQNKIIELELLETKKPESKIRTWNLLAGF